MPKKKKALSAIEVKRINAVGRHAVGGVNGLCMNVKPGGAKSWVLRLVVNGRRHSLGLGSFPETTLAFAREQARTIKQRLKLGEDILMKAPSKTSMSFARAARLCYESKKLNFRNHKHSVEWISSLERYVFPVFGNMDVDAVSLPHILEVLEPIWTEKTETATRIRQRIEAVLSWAAVSGYRSGENPARWKNHLDQVLPKPSAIKKVRHYKAMSYQDIGAFMKKLRSRKGFAARALEFGVLTAARSGEIRFATWDEFNFDDNIWTIPGDRMKTGKKHRVPLSKQAVRLLACLPVMQGVDFVFPSPTNKALSDMAMTTLLRKMGVDVTQHGFRSTFRTWCSETTNYPREIAEVALSHIVGNSVERAYNRGTLLDKRSRLMQSWADYCDIEVAQAEVLPTHGAV